MLVLFSWLLLVASGRAASLAIQSPRFTILSSNATQLRSETIDISKSVLPELELGPTDTLKLTFLVTEQSSGKGVQPHQTFLKFYDEVSGEEGIQPVRVTPGGKAKFELNLSRPPSSLPPTTESQPLSVTLILGSFVHDPSTIPLLSLLLPASQPTSVHPDEIFFHPQPLIEHTFRPDPKLPPKTVSAVFTSIVLAPWIVLLVLWSTISPSLPHLFSVSMLPFTAFLTAFEGLLVWYWLELKLGQVLLYGAILAVPTVLVGNRALAERSRMRTGGK